MDITPYQQRMSAAVDHFKDELKKLRTGRAHPSMLEGLVVQAYGTPMPIIQVGTITAPEAQLLQITPFDPSNIQAITSAIRDNQSLGLNPMDDGRVVRIPVPALTTERRQQIVKQLGEKVEEANIAMRNIRHDAIRAVDQAKKDKQIGEDDAKRLEKQVDEAMTKQKAEVDATAKTKEQEIMTV
ncbi:MAG: ribosome-recycling factor [Candidatus Saccharibacteria bacterium]|nr:ribosome-recycling factor [Candidatus Saccharibacteria bacterium]